MKKITNILIGMALCAVSAKANFTLNPGGADTVVIGTPSQQVSYYTLIIPAGGNDGVELAYNASTLTFLNSAITSGDGITATAAFDTGDSSPALSGLTSSSYTSVAPGTYSVAVKWTLAGTVGLGTYDANSTPTLGAYGILFGLKDQSAAGVTTTLYDTVNVVPVPEPAQAIASVALLGCGGLIFIGRRFVSKKA